MRAGQRGSHQFQRPITVTTAGTIRDSWRRHSRIYGGRLQQSVTMRTAPLSTDQQLLAHLQAPPELRDGVESLGYWRERGRRLPWYRVLARREAARMTIRWERRVRAALVSQRGVPVALRVSAGLLVARIRLRRWSRIALIGLTATVAVALIAAPAIGTVVLLLHAF